MPIVTSLGRIADGFATCLRWLVPPAVFTWLSWFIIFIIFIQSSPTESRSSVNWRWTLARHILSSQLNPLVQLMKLLRKLVLQLATSLVALTVTSRRYMGVAPGTIVQSIHTYRHRSDWVTHDPPYARNTFSIFLCLTHLRQRPSSPFWLIMKKVFPSLKRLRLKSMSILHLSSNH